MAHSKQLWVDLSFACVEVYATLKNGGTGAEHWFAQQNDQRLIIQVLRGGKKKTKNSTEGLLITASFFLMSILKVHNGVQCNTKQGI